MTDTELLQEVRRINAPHAQSISDSLDVERGHAVAAGRVIRELEPVEEFLATLPTPSLALENVRRLLHEAREA